MTSKLPKTSVLLIESSRAETDIYSGLIREVTDCEIDVMSRVSSSFDWVARLNYHLVIIDTSAIKSEEVEETGNEPDLGIKNGENKEVPVPTPSNQSKSKSLGGIALLERIKRVSPDTSVILLADNASIEEAVAAIRSGAEDYLKKPFNLDLFKLAIKRGLEKKFVFGDDSGASDYLHLLHSCQMISSSLDQKKIFEIVQSYFSQELDSNYTAVFSSKGKNVVRVSDGFQDLKTDPALEEILDISVCAVNPFNKMIDRDENYQFFDRSQLTPGLFVFRFQCAGKNNYFCVCLAPKKPELLDSFENRLNMLKRQIEATGKNIEQYMGVKHLVYRDDATGLYNTRYLHNVLEREIKQAKKTKKSFAVLFIDADRFKSINDQHGHLVGTNLLNELGRHLQKLFRGTDTVFRYGGDEFVAVLSPSDLKTAAQVAERVRSSIDETTFVGKEGLHLKFTVSVGVALFPDHATSRESIIEMADQAMYIAKKKSRNSVYIVNSEHMGGLTQTPSKESPSPPQKKKA